MVHPVYDEIRDTEIHFREYVMSCRVAGKWIEPALMKWLQNKYQANKVYLLGSYNKNSLLIRTLKEFGFQDQAEGIKLRMYIMGKDMNWINVVEVIDKTWKML